MTTGNHMLYILFYLCTVLNLKSIQETFYTCSVKSRTSSSSSLSSIARNATCNTFALIFSIASTVNWPLLVSFSQRLYLFFKLLSPITLQWLEVNHIIIRWWGNDYREYSHNFLRSFMVSLSGFCFIFFHSSRYWDECFFCKTIHPIVLFFLGLCSSWSLMNVTLQISFLSKVL